jgi:glycosyltransferase involved in cell wall biosynthesis
MNKIDSRTDRREVALFLLNNLGVGGSEWKVIRTANALKRRGRMVCIAYLNGPHSLREQIDDGIPVVCLERSGKFSIKTLTRLKDAIDKFSATKILCVHLYPALYLFALRLLRFSGNISVAILINTTNFVAKKNERQMWLYRYILRKADKLVFGCIAQMQKWVEQYRLDRNRCMHIYNGVDNLYFSPTQELAATPKLDELFQRFDGHFLVGTIGRLNPVKRQEDLVIAVNKARKLGAKNLRAVITGEGPSRSMLEQLVRSHSLEQEIIFSGEVDDVRPVLRNLDVFVLTSTSETFSNAALEAMAMGRCVVLSDVDGAREMLSDGSDGILYQCGDTTELANILFDLSQDPRKVSKYGERALRAISHRFTFDQMVNAYENLAFTVTEDRAT